MHSRQRVWLILPIAILCAADVGLTLAGQPAGYLSGNYELAHEANPLARPAMVCGPTAFIGLALIEIAAVAAIVLWWHHTVAVCLAGVVAGAHAVGGAAWLTKLEPWGWVYAGVYLIVAAEGSSWCWRRANEQHLPEKPSSDDFALR